MPFAHPFSVRRLLVPGAGFTRAVTLGAALLASAAATAQDAFRSPFAVELSPDASMLAVSDRTAKAIYLIDANSRELTAALPLAGEGMGLAWTLEGGLIVAEYDHGTLARINAATGEVVDRFTVAKKPVDVVVVGDALAVTEYGLGELLVLDRNSGALRHRVPLAQQPFFATAIPGSSIVAAGHLIPEVPSTSPQSAASVSLVDTRTGQLVRQIRLPYGSTNVRQLAASPDGKWVYVLHTIGRIALPTTQLERGWINTNAITIIDAQQGKHLASLLLDRVMEGASDPWGIELTADGSTAYITLAGAHELAVLDLAGLHGLIEGTREPSDYSEFSGSSGEVWTEIQRGERSLDELSYHLSALFGEGLLQRNDLDLPGPRGLALMADGTVAIGGYYAGGVGFYTPEAKMVGGVSLGEQPEQTMARYGEEIFHSARYSFQKWTSCASCHPDGRADGLNWDLLNDGIGNPKNGKSLLLTHATPPAMSTGVRPNFRVALEAGMVHFQLFAAQQQHLDALAAYFESMEPEVASETELPGFAEKVERGRKVFEDKGCLKCHDGEYYTDMKLHDVGTKAPHETHDAFDTPTLVEIWRSAPYLHDGRAATLEDLFAKEGHGRVEYTEQEVADLVAYLKSL